MTPVGSPKGWGDLGRWAELNGLFQLDVRTSKFTKDGFLVGWGWRESYATHHGMQRSISRLLLLCPRGAARPSFQIIY